MKVKDFHLDVIALIDIETRINSMRASLFITDPRFIKFLYDCLLWKVMFVNHKLEYELLFPFLPTIQLAFVKSEFFFMFVALLLQS